MLHTCILYVYAYIMYCYYNNKIYVLMLHTCILYVYAYIMYCYYNNNSY